MKLNEAIYVMLLHNELQKHKDPETDLYKINGNEMTLKNKKLVDMANDLATYLDENKENVIID